MNLLLKYHVMKTTNTIANRIVKSFLISSFLNFGIFGNVLTTFGQKVFIKKKMVSTVILLITLLISSNFVSATTATWVGGSGGTASSKKNWNVAGNWDIASIPTTSNDVIIPSGTTYSPNIYEGDDGYARNLTINSGATLTVANTSFGALQIYGNLANQGTINHTGTIYIYMYGSGKTFGGSGNFFSGVASPFNFASGSSYTLQNDVTMRHMYVDAGGSFDMNGYNVTTEFFFQVGTFYLRTGTLNI